MLGLVALLAFVLLLITFRSLAIPLVSILLPGPSRTPGTAASRPAGHYRLAVRRCGDEQQQ